MVFGKFGNTRYHIIEVWNSIYNKKNAEKRVWSSAWGLWCEGFSIGYRTLNDRQRLEMVQTAQLTYAQSFPGLWFFKGPKNIFFCIARGWSGVDSAVREWIEMVFKKPEISTVYHLAALQFSFQKLSLLNNIFIHCLVAQTLPPPPPLLSFSHVWLLLEPWSYWPCSQGWSSKGCGAIE